MKPRRHRLRLLLVALGAFVVLVGCAAVLLRLGEPRTRETASRPEPSVPTAPVDPERQTDPIIVDLRTEAGATSAALAYAAAPQAWLYMTDDEVRDVVASLAVPSAADQLGAEVVDEIASARVRLADAAGPIWWIVHPLAWKVESFTPNDATVSVWTFSFLSAADVAMPQTEWTTTAFDLEWSQGTWRVVTVTEAVGPTPAVGPSDQPWEPEPLDDALEGFTRLAGEDFR